jgi:rod shape-determining protein MreB
VGDGDVIDQRVAGLALQHFVARVCGRQRIFRPDLMLSVPSSVTGVERRAVLEAGMRAGAKSAYLIEKPLAAAIGAGLPIATTPGLAIGHLGAGSTEVAVIASGDMVAIRRLREGGAVLDRAIAAAILRTHALRLSEVEANASRSRSAPPPRSPTKPFSRSRAWMVPLGPTGSASPEPRCGWP